MNLIQIYYKNDDFDVVSKQKVKDIKTAGFKTDFKFKTENIYRFNGELTELELTRIADEILLDRVIQNYSINSMDNDVRYKDFFIADIWLKNGVTDPVGETIQKAINTIGITKNIEVHTGFRYLISKDISKNLAEEMVSKILMNSVIQICEVR